ncbi:hypothetical protein DB771_28675 [Burkholderia sp. AU29985]|nr:hypothetical protein EGY28_27245 [Burkholderia dolosa]PRE45982.1 hypothetical protein C6P87_19845 [Burkholderia sp. AU12872]PUA73507.1 hypothetical protein DB771_28675 [Burkholderia sp. AU29985]
MAGRALPSSARHSAAEVSPRFSHRLQRWVLGVTGWRRRTLNRSAAQRPSCYPTLPYASRALTPEA